MLLGGSAIMVALSRAVVARIKEAFSGLGVEALVDPEMVGARLPVARCEVTSPAFVIRADGDVVAAAGYRLWPRRTAHRSVLTAPGRRGRGLGRAAATRAVTHALAAGLRPQWRARPMESRRVAAALDFCESGAQFSFKPA